MALDLGARPRGGWARLASEILVEDFNASLAFWCDTLGFRITYQRPGEKFAYLDLQGAQIMICQRYGGHGVNEPPYGRGVTFKIEVDDLGRLLAALKLAGWPLHAGPREVWRPAGDYEEGQVGVFVQDPDGYLLLFYEDLGPRPVRRGQ